MTKDTSKPWSPFFYGEEPTLAPGLVLDGNMIIAQFYGPDKEANARLYRHARELLEELKGAEWLLATQFTESSISGAQDARKETLESIWRLFDKLGIKAGEKRP